LQALPKIFFFSLTKFKNSIYLVKFVFLSIKTLTKMKKYFSHLYATWTQTRIPSLSHLSPGNEHTESVHFSVWLCCWIKLVNLIVFVDHSLKLKKSCEPVHVPRPFKGTAFPSSLSHQVSWIFFVIRCRLFEVLCLAIVKCLYCLNMCSCKSMFTDILSTFSNTFCKVLQNETYNWKIN